MTKSLAHLKEFERLRELRPYSIGWQRAFSAFSSLLGLPEIQLCETVTVSDMVSDPLYEMLLLLSQHIM